MRRGRESLGLLFTPLEDPILRAYLFTLAPALLNIRSLTLDFGRFIKLMNC